MAREISEQVEGKKDMRKAMIYLQKYGISTTLAAKIYKHYGQGIYHVLEENPYQMADDIQGVGFKTADEIASRIGIHTDSDYRIRSGIFYTLQQSAAEGHICLLYTSRRGKQSYARRWREGNISKKSSAYSQPLRLILTRSDTAEDWSRSWQKRVMILI